VSLGWDAAPVIAESRIGGFHPKSPLKTELAQLAIAANVRHYLRMKSGDCRYIWGANDWPRWRYDLATLAGLLTEVSRGQGLLLGRLTDVGLALRNQANLLVLTEDVVKTSEIEGEQLNVESVRSSLARRLGVDIGALAPVDRHVDGVVEMILDATVHCQRLLPEDLPGYPKSQCLCQIVLEST
jgi:hypothetical protein